MANTPFRVTRRAAFAGLGAAVCAPAALAAPSIAFPLRIAVARVSSSGFVHIRSDEQAFWTRMAMRLGGLIDTVAPLQPADMLGGGLPRIEGAASCALVARQMAADAGYGHVILYATHDGQQTRPAYDNWFSESFANLQASVAKDGRATGEAHLLSVDGGVPLATAHADAPPRDLLNLFDGDRNPEREALNALVVALEHNVLGMARTAYASSRSIAD